MSNQSCPLPQHQPHSSFQNYLCHQSTGAKPSPGTPQPGPGGYRQELALFTDTGAAVSLAAALVLHIQRRGNIHATSQHSVGTMGPQGGGAGTVTTQQAGERAWGAKGSQRQKTRPPIDRERYI